jgi:hypothetical protein
LQSEVKQLRAEVRGNLRSELESILRQQLGEQMQRDLNAALAQVTEQASQSATTEAQMLIAAVARTLEEKRVADQQATLAALQKVNAQRVSDYASLRKELETVAVLTEAGFQRAQNQIVNLAYSPANPNPSADNNK